MHKLIIASALLLAQNALAADTTAPPAPPAAAPTPPPPAPETKQTVDAFAGKWAMDAEITPAGAPAGTKFKMTVDCKKAALGNAVDCTMDGKVPNMGPIAQTCLMGWDPATKAVHMMCMTSMGEVHDHKGAWKDDKTLEFEPYKFTMDGKQATETNSFNWLDPKSIAFTSLVTFADGTKMSLAGHGKRK